MGRKKRNEFAGALFHIWARRVDRWVLFVDDEDYEFYVRLLARTVAKYGWVLHEFCLMPNHVHFLIELTEPNLADGMQHLQQRYVRYYNDRHGRKGRLFEDRFRWKPVLDELYFLTVRQYIAQNPVGAVLCKRPEEYEWSARGFAAQHGPQPWLSKERSKLKDGAWHHL